MAEFSGFQSCDLWGDGLAAFQQKHRIPWSWANILTDATTGAEIGDNHGHASFLFHRSGNGATLDTGRAKGCQGETEAALHHRNFRHGGIRVLRSDRARNERDTFLLEGTAKGGEKSASGEVGTHGIVGAVEGCWEVGTGANFWIKSSGGAGRNCRWSFAAVGTWHCVQDWRSGCGVRSAKSPFGP